MARRGGTSRCPPRAGSPLSLEVGPLYGEPAQLKVARAAPHEMPWLQLRTGVRGQFPAQATPTGDVLLSAPTTDRRRPVTTGEGRRA